MKNCVHFSPQTRPCCDPEERPEVLVPPQLVLVEAVHQGATFVEYRTCRGGDEGEGGRTEESHGERCRQ